MPICYFLVSLSAAVNFYSLILVLLNKHYVMLFLNDSVLIFLFIVDG